jgi:hypothetical protein
VLKIAEVKSRFESDSVKWHPRVHNIWQLLDSDLTRKNEKNKMFVLLDFPSRAERQM